MEPVMIPEIKEQDLFEVKVEYSGKRKLQANEATVDWVKAGAVTSVKNQGFCASGYAFAAVGAMEASHLINSEELLEFSSQ